METRFRRGTMERIRRKASDALDRAIAAGGLTDFDPAKPWNYVFSVAVEDALAAKYWHINIEEPALLILAGCRSTAAFLDGDAAVADSSLSHLATSGTPGLALVADSGARGSGRSSDSRPPPSNQAPKRAKTGSGPSVPYVSPGGGARQKLGAKIGPDGRYTTNRSGNYLCVSFNAGSCESKKGNPICPKDVRNRHNCSVCLSGDHSAQECTKQPGMSGNGPAARGGKK
jgi:hypothetical protein